MQEALYPLLHPDSGIPAKQLLHLNSSSVTSANTSNLGRFNLAYLVTPGTFPRYGFHLPSRCRIFPRTGVPSAQRSPYPRKNSPSPLPRSQAGYQPRHSPAPKCIQDSSMDWHSDSMVGATMRLGIAGKFLSLFFYSHFYFLR